VKSGYRYECDSRIRLFIAYTVICYVQFTALELPIQISQYVLKYNWQRMHQKLQPEGQIAYVFALADHRCIVQSVSFIIHNLARLLWKSEVK